MIVDLFCVDCGVTTRHSASMAVYPRNHKDGSSSLSRLVGTKTGVVHEYVELAILCKGCHQRRVASKAEAASG